MQAQQPENYIHFYDAMQQAFNQHQATLV